VFRNTELIYDNRIGRLVGGMRDERGERMFLGMLSEGSGRALAGRTPDCVYEPRGVGGGFGLLLKHGGLSEELAFRFGERSWGGYPLLAESFADWAAAECAPAGEGQVCNVFLDYETLGEHQWRETGILDFMRALPGAIRDRCGSGEAFLTAGEALERFGARGVYDAEQTKSWADSERDLSAWCGNAMQADALKQLYGVESLVKRRAAEARAAGEDGAESAGDGSMGGLLESWRRLTTSDHFYYMGTKYAADGESHRYFSPYGSPYEGYINFMNVLDDLRTRAESASPA
jgi:alpha-amylase